MLHKCQLSPTKVPCRAEDSKHFMFDLSFGNKAGLLLLSVTSLWFLCINSSECTFPPLQSITHQDSLFRKPGSWNNFVFSTTRTKDVTDYRWTRKRHKWSKPECSQPTWALCSKPQPRFSVNDQLLTFWMRPTTRSYHEYNFEQFSKFYLFFLKSATASLKSLQNTYTTFYALMLQK